MGAVARRLLTASLLVVAACNRPKQPLIEDLTRQTDVSRWTVQELVGHRDGDRLAVVLVIGDQAQSISSALRFQIGSPTTLAQGAWVRDRGLVLSSRPVRARSVTFLGGQDGPPSIGGSFELIDGSGTLKYRIHLPVTPLKVEN